MTTIGSAGVSPGVGLLSDEARAAAEDGGLPASLVQLGNQLRSSPDIDGVVRAVATAAASTFGFNEVSVYLRTSSGDEFRALATVGEDDEIDRRILSTPVPATVVERLLDERYRLGCAFFLDHRSFTWPKEFAPYMPSPDLGLREDGEWHPDDALLVPLCDHSARVIGVLDLADPADRRLPDLSLARELEVFATYAALAVESARQYEELQGAKREMELQLEVRHDLLDLSRYLLVTLDHTAVFEQIADVLKSLVDYDCIDISLVDEAQSELVTIFAQDAYADQIMAFRVPLDQGVSGWVVRHKQAQLVNDMYTDPRVVQIPGTGQEPQASILAPLMFIDKVLGVLIIDRLGGRTFEQHELETTQLFANLAAIAIRNARSYKEMEVQASTDGLTGLNNHRHFQETLSAEVARAERYETGFCLLMMDLDRFKVVNDTIGHQRGDDVLRAVAGVLRRCSRESDFVARYGGEEFAMILPNADGDEACRVAERIRSQVAELQLGVVAPAGEGEARAEADTVRFAVTISVGVASYPDAGPDKDDVIGAADGALLTAKAHGRNRVCTSLEMTTPFAAELSQPIDTPLASLGQRFAVKLGLADEETVALAAALHVVEAGRRVGPELVGAESSNGDSDGRSPAVGRLFEALLYGTERWDGRGYPEGLRGEAIPAVARAYAVLQAYAKAGAGAIPAVRARAGKELDPRMVNRFLAFLAEEAKAWSPLQGSRAAGFGGPHR
jgi:diguanylate cyclase (GGDEF)-like protein